ncbi:GSCOCT00000510001.3-RA-CDS [Cotesia congregata]|uniref:Odorant receptor n=1 Tax=Cotesia congregata TaxID=51543 RepID=A0A8J2H9S2_COTCN|nr:GSCOCT00000510001.3-RA-CDS [Cotesia congregata]CAG5087784.1 olfactory receptor 17 [Cotesia congregata]
MIFKATPEFAIAFTKFTSLLSTSWPNYPGSPKWKFVVFQIRWWATFFLAVSAFLPMCYGAYNHWRNILSFTKSLFDAVNTIQTFVKMILCKIHYKKMQYLLWEMEKYVLNAKPHDREMFILYIKRCGKLHVVSMICGFMTIAMIIIAPIGMPQPFPNIVEYPFSTEGHPVFELIYLHQSCATIHCLSILTFDCQIALLLWYAGARLELLSQEFHDAADYKSFNECVKKHQYLLGYIQDIVISSRHILATTVINCVLATITSGIHIVGNEPVAIKVPFVVASAIISVVLYVTAWPCEHLAHMCKIVGIGLYNSPWFQNTKQMNTSVLIVIQRSQKVASIDVAGILPSLSLSYYATFLSKIFSYFTTLRVMLSKMEID